MSPPHYPGMLPPMRLDAPLPTATALLHPAQGTVHPSVYPFPGTSHPSLAHPNPPFQSFAPALYNTSAVNHFQNFQRYCMPYLPQTSFAPTGNYIPPAKNPNDPTPAYPSNSAWVGYNNGPDLLSSEGAGQCQYEQHTQFTSQSSAPTQCELSSVPGQQNGFHAQPEAPFVQQVQGDFPVSAEVASFQGFQQTPDGFSTQFEPASVMGHQRVQNGVQGVQQDFFVGAPPSQLGEDHKESSQAHGEPCAPPVQSGVTTNYMRRHICSCNPRSVCPGDGLLCIDFICRLVERKPEGLSPETIARAFVVALSTASNARKSAVNQFSQTEPVDPSALPNRAESLETASLSSSASDSRPNSPSVSCISSLSDDDDTSDSTPMFVVGSSTGKRKRSQGYSRNTVHRCDCEHQDSDERPRKRRRPVVDGEFFCLICRIFQETCPPFSRKDSLKRHILKLHPMFEILFHWEQKEFGILSPRKTVENLDPLIEYCIGVQADARRNGVQIRARQDLALLHPTVAANMQQS